MNYADMADEALLTAIHAGDARAEEALYERYKPVVRSRARTYFLMGADREDLIQEGMIGLYKAVCDFDAARQTSFRAFAELCITRQIISAIKSATRKKHMPLNTYVSLNRTVYDDDSDRTLIDVLESAHVSDPEAMYIGRENYEAMADSIRRSLTRLEKQALGLYLTGMSYQQIAETMARSVKCVDNAIQRVKRKLEASYFS